MTDMTVIEYPDRQTALAAEAVAIENERPIHNQQPGRSDVARVERDWFSSAEVVILAGVTYRQLDYWCRTGRVTPMADAEGIGSRRRFSADQVQEIISVKREMTGVAA